MDLRITPKNFIISILQVSNNEAIAIKALIAMGRLFGFSSNSIRVTAARLLREGRIESDERGLYRLKDVNSPVSRFFNSWRTGESRVSAWDGGWLCCLLQKGPAVYQKGVEKALSLLGFREGLPHLWVRPSNLVPGMDGIKAILDELCPGRSGEFFTARDFSPRITEQWRRYLWPVDDLIRSCIDIQKKLGKSSARLGSMPVSNAVVESYLLGTEAVHWLISDPCLPEEMMSAEYRASLTQVMLKYDDLGKGIWSKEFGDYRFDFTPSHLRVVTNR